MPEIPSIGHGSVGPMDRAAPASMQSARGKPEIDRTSERLGDRVELSEHARFLALLRQSPDSRLETIRRAIGKEIYETDDKLDGAIDRLLEDLRRSGM